MKKIGFIGFIVLLLLLAACSTRQIREDYAGATEQRLVSHSVNDLMEILPDKDISILAGHKVFLECFFLDNTPSLDYARRRLEMQLIEKYQCELVADSGDAEFLFNVFFTAIGTDFDKFGLSTPELVLPGAGGASSIDIIALEKYHGISELYYYILDSDNRMIAKGETIKKVVRDDSLALPVITIPINTVD